jgi:hypothetical protein
MNQRRGSSRITAASFLFNEAADAIDEESTEDYPTATGTTADAETTRDRGRPASASSGPDGSPLKRHSRASLVKRRVVGHWERRALITAVGSTAIVLVSRFPLWACVVLPLWALTCEAVAGWRFARRVMWTSVVAAYFAQITSVVAVPHLTWFSRWVFFVSLVGVVVALFFWNLGED